MAKYTKKDLKRLFWRSWPIMASFNYERLQAQGFVFALMPFLRDLYTKKEDFIAAMKRHLTFFNTTPQCAPFILGTTLALEEEYAKNPDGFDVETINAAKVALMGPLAAIGDSFFWGTFRIIGVAVGAPLAVKGNILGPIMFILIYNIPNFYVRWKGTFIGYEQGMNFITNASEAGLFENLMEAAKIVGLVVIGGMIASMVSLSTPLVLKIDEGKVVVQEIIDGIFPCLLPLLATLGVWNLLKRKISTTWVLLIIIALSILGKYIGVV
ncbi:MULTISPECIES: PTS system mannose/fructose/sorbose family transporter subunit IID [Tepidanaerobacter]|uniref:PTS system, mannose-specific IID component n=1 Tax=Tepidanaerobacter syntrophicus TaxID=224999 RepID=A0A0U9HLS4_9FIRM|nr:MULTISPECIES: PTS system mannose/fructose/sorbose family transporter subunit IID [Tepidanaerobacter]GAQ25283.1 PTS system, mannose-specific IID component [Tepidanaerobacter syntrophicus]